MRPMMLGRTRNSTMRTAGAVGNPEQHVGRPGQLAALAEPLEHDGEFGHEEDDEDRDDVVPAVPSSSG